MSWTMLIQILIAVFNQRMAAGWPLLKKLLERLGGQIQADAEAAGDMVIGAAPEDLKAIIIQFLTGQREKAGVMMKVLYSLLLSVLPRILDGVWDELFAAGRVPTVFASFPVVFAAEAPVDEETAFNFAVAASGISPHELTLALAA